MKKSIVFFCVVLLGLNPVFAQIGTSNEGAGSMNRNDNEEIMNSFLKGISRNETPTEVKGSPYLDSDFQQARLIFPENDPLPAPVRYDVVKEEMQVQIEEGSFRILHPSVVVSLNNRPFKMMNYKGENKTIDLLGYFEILTPNYESQDLVLLKKHKKDMRRGKAAAAMQQATPPRYVDKDDFYLMFKDAKPVLAEKKTRDFVQLFPEAHQDQVEQFMKENKLKSKKLNDLEAVVNYYNSTF